MPSLIKTTLDLDAVHKEIRQYKVTHTAMSPFIIMNSETIAFIQNDVTASIQRKWSNIPVTHSGTISMLFECNVAVCENLAFGEFKVR